MAGIGFGSSLPDKLQRKKQQKKTFVSSLLSVAGLIIILGLLITATGIICFAAFKSKLAKLIVDTGIILCLGGFVLKLFDICMKISGRQL